MKGHSLDSLDERACAPVINAAGDRARVIEAHEVVFIANADDIIEIDDRFDGFALGEVILKIAKGAVLPGPEFRREKPPVAEAQSWHD